MKFYAVLNKREKKFADTHPDSALAKIDSSVIRCVSCGASPVALAGTRCNACITVAEINSTADLDSSK